MAKKKDGMYANSYDSAGADRRGAYMIGENMSEPSNMPRGNKSVYYPDIECGGMYVDDSVNASDRDSSMMSRGLRAQALKERIF